ncbi:hypothetical protein N7486_006554 [Penicillium sp. IBT 16267x]|nr:hypothetical protein N7486_006554 [Penicillium sp. IBT 16267x]
MDSMGTYANSTIDRYSSSMVWEISPMRLNALKRISIRNPPERLRTRYRALYDRGFPDLVLGRRKHVRSVQGGS